MRLRPLKYSLALATVLAGVSTVSAQAADTFSCRASTARVATLGLTLEPFVANRADKPCRDDSASLIAPTTIGPVSAAVINARTDSNPGGAPGANAETQAAGAGIALAGLPVITADVLHTKASARCVNGQPAFSDSSVVANVRIGGLLVNVPNGNAIVTRSVLGLATLYINERVVSSSRVTRRALRLRTILGTEVVLAESTANREGNPCAVAPPTTQCSDGVDNVDPEDMLVDEFDPGCHTDGNAGNQGSYNPGDNDETNVPSGHACSNKADDDDDKLIDQNDPGCHTDGNPDNPSSYDGNDDDETDPACSDGKDNDGDKAIDEGDPQCHSDGDPKNKASYLPGRNSES
jgi:hypothetical protein